MAKKTLTREQGVPVADNQNPLTVGNVAMSFFRIST
jgi:hypothetical protein